MNLLVTGSRGFIGRNLCDRLIGDGHEVAGLDIKAGGDVRVFNSERKFDAIFHCAAQASILDSFEKPIESHGHNVLGTVKMLEHAKKTQTPLIFSSSSSIYDLKSPYALQKKICEDYLKFYWQLGVKSVALRYFNVFGEGQEEANGGYALVLSIFLKQYQNRMPFTIVGTGEQRRDFVYVGDVVEANLQALEWLKTAKKFKVFDVGWGDNYSINEVVNMISPKQLRVQLPPRIEPFENKANKKRWLRGWRPKVKLAQWLQLQLS